MNENLNNYLVRKIQFKIIDFLTQIAKDKLHKLSRSVIVLQRDNMTDAEFEKFEEEIIKKLKNKYSVSKCKIKITEDHKILVISDRMEAGLPEGV
jgi:chaperonin GroEL (HSP60 family)